MNVEIAVVTRLKSAAPVTALVGTRVRQLKLKQSETMPAIRVQLISERFTSHLRGANNTRPSRVQVDSYAGPNSTDPYSVASAVADAAFDALTGAPWSDGGSPISVSVLAVPNGDRRVIYEAEELNEVRIMQEFSIVSRRMT